MLQEKHPLVKQDHDPKDVSKALEVDADHIEVLDMVHYSNRDTVRARCKVKIGPILISDVKVVLPVLASRVFVGWPSRKDGETWRSLVTILSPTLEQAVTDAVIAAWRGGAR